MTSRTIMNPKLHLISNGKIEIFNARLWNIYHLKLFIIYFSSNVALPISYKLAIFVPMEIFLWYFGSEDTVSILLGRHNLHGKDGYMKISPSISIWNLLMRPIPLLWIRKWTMPNNHVSVKYTILIKACSRI